MPVNDVQNLLTQAEGMRRDRIEKIGPSDVARSAPETTAADSGGSAVSDVSGYWNGSGYQSYFLVGISLLGGTDVLK